MDKQYLYVVVHFTATDEVELVPYIWLRDNGRKTLWPPFSAKAVTKAVKDRLVPRTTDEQVWERYNVRILRRCETFEEGRRKAREAENTSDLQTDLHTDIDLQADDQPIQKRKQRKRRRPPQWSSDDDDDNVIDGDDRNDGDDIVCGPSSHSALHPAPAVTSLLSGINSPALPLNSRQHSSESERSLTPYSYTLSRPNQLESRQKAGTSTNSRSRLDSQSERSLNSTPARPLMETRQITGTGRDLAILKVLSEVQVKLGEITNQLTNHTQMLSKLQTTTGTEADLEISLPIQTLAELDEVESALTDTATKSSLINHLARIGGDNIRDGVWRAMGRLLAHSVQLELNWNGRAGWKTKDGKTRRAFGGTKLSRVVTRAMMKSIKGTSEAEVEDAVMTWLRGKKDRNGGRKRRSKETRRGGEDDQLDGDNL